MEISCFASLKSNPLPQQLEAGTSHATARNSNETYLKQLLPPEGKPFDRKSHNRIYEIQCEEGNPKELYCLIAAQSNLLPHEQQMKQQEGR